MISRALRSMRVAVSVMSLTGAPTTTASGRSTGPSQVVRHVLTSSHPLTAPGETFELVEYIIPARAVLPVHRHPGVQMATVASGALTYHVISHGSVEVNRANGDHEVVGPGQSVTFHKGDSWVEPIGMVHYAENLGDEPVILMSTSLLDDHHPPTELVDEQERTTR